MTQAPDEDVAVGGGDGDAIRTRVSVMGSTYVGPGGAVGARTAVDGVARLGGASTCELPLAQEM